MKRHYFLTAILVITMFMTLGLSSLLNAGAAPLANHVTPTFAAGNPSCPAGTIELKVEPVASGNYDDGTLFVTVTVVNTASGPTFNWSSNIGVDTVIVKGGSNANVFNYSPEATSDTGLHAPVNASNGQYFGLSHISFCYDVEPPTNTPTDTATSTVTNTATDTPTNTPTDTPTNTPTDTPTNTPTDTPTNTPTDTPTNTPTDTPTNTPTDTPTNTPTFTPTKTPTPEQAQLKVCKVAGSGVQKGQIFSFKVNGVSYNVPAGYCVLAGQFPLNVQVTIQETIPAGYFVSGIEVKPSDRTVSKDKNIGKVVVKIGSGVTEAVFTNKKVATPTPTRTPLTMTSTPKPTRTPLGCAPNCTPTATPVPTGRMQICKEAGGPDVSGYFTFRFNTRSRSVPVGSCTLIISVNAGTLVVKEDARSGYVVSDIYTIPANRLISKNLNDRTATVTVVQGNAASQTIVVFVNSKVTSQAPNGTTAVYAPSSGEVGLTWQGLWDMILGKERRLESTY